MVSSMWLSNVPPGSSTAAIPPCAHAVEPDEMLDFASTTTFSLGARVSAAVSPAAPEPMMMTSASTSAIGGGSRQAQENILKVRLLGGDVDDAQTGRRQRAEHIPGVHPAPVVADRDDPGRGQRYPAETGRLGDFRQIAVDGDDDLFFMRLPHQFMRRLVDRKSTRLNSSHYCASRMPSSA